MKISNIALAALMALSSLCYADAHSQALLSEAKRGNPASMRKLALALYKGDAGQKNIHYAYEWMEKAAAAGDVPAMYHMGVMCENGRGVTKNMEHAADYYTKAAIQGHKGAIKKLESMDLKYSKSWHEHAAAEGAVKSMLLLANAYAAGESGIRQDDRQALSYYQKAVETNETKALKTIKKSSLKYTLVYWTEQAEKKHDVEAMKVLAEAYASGFDVPRDESKSLTYYGMAADAGDADAKKLIDALPPEKVLPLWEEQAENGHVPACCKAGMAYENGKGTTVDRNKAQHYYARGVSRNKAAMAETMRKEPVPQTRLFWHYMADEEHDADAMLTLATAYAEGGALPPDDQQSKLYYNRAAIAGNAEATQIVSSWPLKDAQAYLKNEAFDGNVSAAMKLAEAYWRGQGLPQNKEEAKRFYRIAAELNHRPAIDFLHQHDPSYKTAAEKKAELVRGIEAHILKAGLSTQEATLLTYQNGLAQEVPLSRLSSIPFENLFLRMPVFQKVANDGFFCLVKNTPICIVVPSHIRVRFAEDDVVSGILVRDGEYRYTNRAGEDRIIRKYRLIYGDNS